MVFTVFTSIAPNIFAVLFWLIAPVITYDVADRLKGKIQAHLIRDKQTNTTNALSLDQMDNYVTWSSDLIQVIPAGLLPVVSAIIGSSGELSAVAAVVISLVAVVAMLIVFFRVAAADPTIYTRTTKFKRKKFPGYQKVPIFAIVINFAAAAAILVISFHAVENFCTWVGQMIDVASD
ncbi:hypothetical protein [Mycobacterium sp. IS-1556]|uniref:hypothetical protein n=1 Tax=Mycobacterium sp. IS-1556 TaxID=1772276 RepID=UPI0007416BB5|nr:hypothetical protein [Mycobacterium sp. IS-1556]KUH84789.1 hypothetical protein AU187_19940 [Mycobacterium sp. IS-1556]